MNAGMGELRIGDCGFLEGTRFWICSGPNALCFCADLFFYGVLNSHTGPEVNDFQSCATTCQ